MSRGLRRKGSFIAKDSQGHSRRLYVWVNIVDIGHKLDPEALIEGKIELKTDSFQRVNVMAKGEYEIVPTGEVLTSDDPNAV